MKSTTYIFEITNKKIEKYLRGKIHLLACLLATRQLKNFLHEFTECFAVFDQSAAQFISCGIGCSYFSGSFLLSFLFLWYDFQILVKSRGGGTFLSLASSVNVRNLFFFQLKTEYLVFHFLDLNGTILNLIQVKINKNH